MFALSHWPAIIFAALPFFFTSVSWGETVEADFYVAGDGNDSWSGQLAAPNEAQTDGPLATIPAARDAIRRLKSQETIAGPLRVLVRGGTYRLDEPIVFTPEDSGTPNAPITYAAYPGENPVISGGAAIRGWTNDTANTWTVQVPQMQRGKWLPRQLFVAEKRRPLARAPNQGTYRTRGPLIPWKDRSESRRDPATKMGFLYRGDDLQSWEDLDDAMLIVYHSWTASRHHIASVDTEKRAVRYTAPSSWPTGYWEDEQRYYVENVRAALDAPGEWYLDQDTGTLTYLAADENLAELEVVAARLPELIRLEGRPMQGEFVEHLRFEGLSLQHADWQLERDQPCDGQAAAFLKTAAFFATGARHCVIDHCEIAHVGGYAAWLEQGCQQNRITQCHFHDLGAGGVRIGATSLPTQESLQTSHNEVHNCWIHDGGHVYHAGVGIWIGKSSHNTLRHNEISDLLYSGISVGWSWGYAPTSAHHNLIEDNHVHHLGKEQLSDMGGIYTLGVSPGTVIRHNLFHDIRSYSYGGWGIYPDEGSTGILIEDNVVSRTKTGGFHQHYGRDNVVRNNIFAFSDEGQLIRTREESHQSFQLERNIVYFNQGTLFGSNWSNGNFRLASNLYWRTDGQPITFPGGRTLEEWQQTGQDVGSRIADPRFVDPLHDNFELRPDSPALQLGFQPIDTTSIGLVGPTWDGTAGKAEAGRALVVPARKGTVHIATQLPDDVKISPQSHWLLVEAEHPDCRVDVALAAGVADDGSVKQDGALLMAAIPPRDGAANPRRFLLQPAGTNTAAGGQRLLYKDVCDNSLGLWEGNDPVLVYNHGVITNEDVPASDHRRRRAAYVHPLWGLNGEILTDDFPADHFHHHGVFWAWPHVGIEDQEYDLWTYRDIQHKFVHWLGREAGSVGAVMGVENGWFIADRQVMTERVWLRVFPATDAGRVIDVALTLIPLDKPVTLQGAAGKSYGGLTMRFAPRPQNDTVITVPSGRTGQDLPDTPLAWADLSGTFADAAGRSGAAMMVDPRHPDYPPAWLTRHYGALCVGWPGVTARTFPPGQPIQLNYRIWIHRDVDVDALREAYANYVAATEVTWE